MLDMILVVDPGSFTLRTRSSGVSAGHNAHGHVSAVHDDHQASEETSSDSHNGSESPHIGASGRVNGAHHKAEGADKQGHAKGVTMDQFEETLRDVSRCMDTKRIQDLFQISVSTYMQFNRLGL